MSIFAPRKKVHLIPYPHGETTLCGKVSGLHSSHNFRYAGFWEIERYRRGYENSQFYSKADEQDLIGICSICRKIAEKTL